MTERKYDASAMLRDAAIRHDVRLSTLVAETGLWANPEAHRRMAAAGGSGAFFPDRRRYRAGQGERAGQRVGALTLDNNNYANNAIKRALGVSRMDLIGFETCHIWPLTCYDERYHTVLANLVLLPRALAGLTDHDSQVSAALQYRAYELYDWHPVGSPKPVKPEDYPITWLDPLPFSGAVARAVEKRLQRLGSPVQGESAGAYGGARANARLDVTIGSVGTSGLPKRIALLTVVKGLVEAGVSPNDIASVLSWRGTRLFRSAAGPTSLDELLQSLSLQEQGRGRTFDPRRYFCKDSQVIVSGGRSYVLNSQWTGEDAERAIGELATAFPAHAVRSSPSALSSATIPNR